ncbi:MAG: HAMP domain-containing histidine kinase [Oscillospiraceae bacterium]|nr:HAMP domain-containing histidine kinase [Oscillospiraceae bacterium]
MRKKRERKTLRSVTLRLCLFGLIMWLAFVGIVTLVTAEYVFSSISREAEAFVSRPIFGMWSSYGDALEHHGEDEEAFAAHMENAAMWEIVAANRQGWGRLTRWNPNRRGDAFSLLRRNVWSDFQTAVIIYDRDGNIFRQSGDIIDLSYYTAEAWEAGQTRDGPMVGRTYIVLGNEMISPEARGKLEASFENFGAGSIFSAFPGVRLTGFFGSHGVEFIPVVFEYIPNEVYWYIRSELSFIPTRQMGSVRDLLREGRVQWQLLFDGTADFDGSQELVTLYSTNFWLRRYNPGGTFRQNGMQAENLLTFVDRVLFPQLLLSEGGFLSGHIQNLWGSNLWNLFMFQGSSIADTRYFDYERGDSFPQPDFRVISAVSVNPLLHAVRELIYVYILSFAICAIVVLGLRRALYRNLVRPIDAINDGFEAYNAGHGVYRYLDCEREVWDASVKLIENYKNATDTLASNKNEITRLQTALKYAKDAEQMRRQTTSNIAHELKTPLAIIHSYSEGLKEHIAEEKRGHYLDVILSESEKMDAMVVEMLDLSRLDAGKVKLSVDEFSLTQLAGAVFEKLEMTIKEKKLTISFEFDGECIMSGDEARMSQVISNFAANAIKYTPSGGHITVRAYQNRWGTSFFVENDSEPFTNPELTKIWEPFYRANNARTNEGTGLGLAIAKSIIELHGGKSQVRNTKTGVEFGFVC